VNYNVRQPPIQPLTTESMNTNLATQFETVVGDPITAITPVGEYNLLNFENMASQQSKSAVSDYLLTL
jgi:hypothetical protein